MDVLVTGAAGMVGRAVVPVLRLAGHRVVATDLPGAVPAADVHADLDASWHTANPGSATELRPVSRPDASGINSGKAQRLLGWQATRSWRDHLTDSGEPR